MGAQDHSGGLDRGCPGRRSLSSRRLTSAKCHARLASAAAGRAFCPRRETGAASARAQCRERGRGKGMQQQSPMTVLLSSIPERHSHLPYSENVYAYSESKVSNSSRSLTSLTPCQTSSGHFPALFALLASRQHDFIARATNHFRTVQIRLHAKYLRRPGTSVCALSSYKAAHARA